MILEIVWLTFAALHTIPFAAYLLYMKHVAEKRLWNIKRDPLYEPTVSVIIPTYNEVTTIEKKLDNMFDADYPADKMEIIIVDSASSDGTPEISQKWAESHPWAKVKLIREDERRGLVKALNVGLKHAEGEVIVKTDSDCLLFRNSLRNAVKYMADPHVGSVAGLHSISAHRKTHAVKVEKVYRKFYRWLRVGESKLYGTVLYEGELMLARRKLMEEMGGYDEEMGGDDVPTALRVAERGYRAITAADAYFLELTPHTWREKFGQKVRRARHVLQALWKYKYLNFRGTTLFNRLILPMETYIYAVNPLLAVPFITLSPIVIARYPWLLVAMILLLFGRMRELASTHLTDIAIMLTAIIKEMGGKEQVTWRKIEEIR